MRITFITKTVDWIFFIVTILFILSGFGITEYKIVEAITFGLLTKSLALKIHFDLWLPFSILLVLHILRKPMLKYIQN